MIHVFRIMPKVIFKITHAQCDSKESDSRFFEGLKMAQVGCNWKGTVAPVLIE